MSDENQATESVDSGITDARAIAIAGAPLPPPSPPPTGIQDIVIHIAGQDPASPSAGKRIPEEPGWQLGGERAKYMPVREFNSKVETPEYLAGHKPLKHFQWYGDGTGNKSLPQEIARTIMPDYDPNGFLIIISISAGGTNALILGEEIELRRPTIRSIGDKPIISYMGICDGALPNNPDNRHAKFNALILQNYYQSLGLSIFPAGAFHGEVIKEVGFKYGEFTNRDFYTENPVLPEDKETVDSLKSKYDEYLKAIDGIDRNTDSDLWFRFKNRGRSKEQVKAIIRQQFSDNIAHGIVAKGAYFKANARAIKLLKTRA